MKFYPSFLRYLGLASLAVGLTATVALATDSDYHYVHYGNAPQGSSNLMEYYDGGGYARKLLPMNLLENGSNTSRPNYSAAPEDNSATQCSVVSPSPSDGAMLHSRPVPSIHDDSQNSIQP